MAATSPLQIAAQLERLQREPTSLFGRDQQLAMLRLYLRSRRSVFVSGPAGVGKTALLHAVYAAWDKEREGVPVFYCGESATRRGIATHLLVNLFLQRGRLESEFVERRKTVGSLSGLRCFVAHERLPDLQRMMHQNLQGKPACLLLDHLDEPDPKVASLVEVWLETMPLVIVARSPRHVGRARWLLSAFEHVEVPLLSPATLLRIARFAVMGRQQLHLNEPDLHAAVELAAGNPRRLKDLLCVAARAEYRRNGAVQWKLVDLDARIRSIGIGDVGRDGRGGA
jgi:AAA ATPase domain